MSQTTIIAVAAGKGGVGKTFLTANLSIALAELGCRTIAVDLDLGSCNLNGFLGIPNRFPGISDYLMARNAELSELMIPTETDNLHLVPGDGKTPFMANIAHAQKIKLISALKKLTADYILLDLGAGSNYNTLDFFGIHPRGILVTSPEPPAVMSMLVFMKNFLLRSIMRSVAGDHHLTLMLKNIFKRSMNEQIPSIGYLQELIAAEDTKAGEAVAAATDNFRPRIIFNLCEHPKELHLTEKISNSLEKVLSVNADYFGFVFREKAVRDAIAKRAAFLPNFKQSLAAESIRYMASAIHRNEIRTMAESARILSEYARSIYGK